MKRRKPRPRPELSVANKSLPPWDRVTAGFRTDLSGHLGRYVVTGPHWATQILDIDGKSLPTFVAAGIVREARIVERPSDQTTFACTTADYDTRFHLEYGETLLNLQFGRPAAWDHDADCSDYDGRICVRIRPLTNGTTDDLTIVTDKRTYRIRLVSNPHRVTIGCSWTYDRPVTMHASGRPLGLPGDRTVRHRKEGMAQTSRFILFRLGPPMRMQLMGWAARLNKVKARQLAAYKTMHTRSGVPHAWKHPRTIMDAVTARAMSVGSFSEGELRQWLPIPEDFQAAVDAVKAHGKRTLVERLALVDRVPTPSEMAQAFPVLAGMPETCLADAETFAEPPERARRIAWSMGPMAEHAAFFCIAAPRHIRRPDVITSTLRDLKVLERLAIDAGLPTDLANADAVGGLIDHVSSSPAADTLTPKARYGVARSLMLVVRTVRRHIRLHDRTGDRGTWRLRPVDTAAVADTLGRLNAMGRGLISDWHMNRKARVFRHAGRVRELEFAADLNLEQVVHTTRALAKAAKLLDDDDWIDVPVLTTIVDSRGRLLPGRQQCIWRVWNAAAYLRRLLAATGDKAERGRIQAYLDRIAAGTPMAPITEYRQTVGLTGSTPVEPFVVRCWRHGLLALPATLPAIVRRRRLAVLRELKLPGFVKSEQALFHGTTDEMDIWRMSLRRHRTIAFLAPFEHGLRYAHYALSTVFENLARTNAVLQQVDDQSGYEVRRLNKQPVVGFLAHDKVSPQGDLPDTMSWFPVGSKHLEEQKELVAMTCTRCGHANGVLPEIRHVETLIWKRPEAAAWIFQFNGKPIHPGTIGRLLRFLLPGHGRITLHDVRHLMANAAHAAGVPGWIISLALNHGKSDLWLYYAQLSNQQESLLEAASVRAIVARSADARSKLALAA